MKIAKSFIVYCLLMLITHLALTQNINNLALGRTSLTTILSDTQPHLQISSEEYQPLTGDLTWLFDWTKTLKESDDSIEDNSDDEHLPHECSAACILCSINHQIKFVSLNQGYIQSFIPFKQAPLFVMFHSWKSYLA